MTSNIPISLNLDITNSINESNIYLVSLSLEPSNSISQSGEPGFKATDLVPMTSNIPISLNLDITNSITESNLILISLVFENSNRLPKSDLHGITKLQESEDWIGSAITIVTNILETDKILESSGVIISPILPLSHFLLGSSILEISVIRFDHSMKFESNCHLLSGQIAVTNLAESHIFSKSEGFTTEKSSEIPLATNESIGDTGTNVNNAIWIGVGVGGGVLVIAIILILLLIARRQRKPEEDVPPEDTDPEPTIPLYDLGREIECENPLASDESVEFTDIIDSMSDEMDEDKVLHHKHLLTDDRLFLVARARLNRI
jgi:hypothetical protein